MLNDRIFLIVLEKSSLKLCLLLPFLAWMILPYLTWLKMSHRDTEIRDVAHGQSHSNPPSRYRRLINLHIISNLTHWQIKLILKIFVSINTRTLSDRNTTSLPQNYASPAATRPLWEQTMEVNCLQNLYLLYTLMDSTFFEKHLLSSLDGRYAFLLYNSKYHDWLIPRTQRRKSHGMIEASRPVPRVRTLIQMTHKK